MRKMTARDGYMYTQSYEVPLEQMVFARELYLGINDSPDNWKEVTESEAQEWMQKQQEKAEYERGLNANGEEAR